MIGRLIVCSTSTMHSTTAAVTAGDEGAPEEMEKTLRGQVPSPSGSVPARQVLLECLRVHGGVRWAAQTSSREVQGEIAFYLQLW